MSDEKVLQGFMNSVTEEMKGEVDNGDPCYERAVDFVKKTFQESCKLLFMMSPSYRFGIVSDCNLFDAFLQCLPEDQRQHYNCNTCRRFIDRYGRLVIINADGTLRSAMWGYPEHEDLLGVFTDVIGLLRNKVENGRVIHLFAEHTGGVLGQEINGGFRHFHAGPLGAESRVLSGISGSINDYINECETNFNLLKSFLSKYANDRGLEILKSIREGFEYDVLFGYKKFHDTLDDLEHVLKYDWGRSLDTTAAHNKIWYHVMHKDSFVKIKNSVLGMLFDDLESGMDFDRAAERFNNAVDPLHYRRPQALPTMTQVKEANKLIEELGLEASFHRRIALVDEIPLLWKQPDVDAEEVKTEESAGGLFSNIPTKERREATRSNISRPTQDKVIPITWAKFQRDVLPNATSISVTMRNEQNYPFTTILTATDMDAKPILRYDVEDHRCPFSGYMRKNGAPTKIYGLDAIHDDDMGSMYSFLPKVMTYNIVGICTTPYDWADDEHKIKMNRGIIMLVEGANDYNNSTVALFPEILIPELYPHRKVIESYSANTQVDYDERYETHNLACGLYMVDEEGSCGLPFKVTTKDGTEVRYVFSSYE